jgi:hypothetical protein
MGTDRDEDAFNANDKNPDNLSINDADEVSNDDEQVPPTDKKRRREHVIIAAVAALVLLVIGILLFRKPRCCGHRD